MAELNRCDLTNRISPEAVRRELLKQAGPVIIVDEFYIDDFNKIFANLYQIIACVNAILSLIAIQLATTPIRNLDILYNIDTTWFNYAVKNHVK